MTQEEKQLLLKDLCARLPYHPTVKIYNDSWEGCKIGEFDNWLCYHHVEAFSCDRIGIKPYLRPMSSMTDEEKAFLDATKEIEYTQTGLTGEGILTLESYDYLNSIHVDCRGLIEKGLALEALKGIYKND